MNAKDRVIAKLKGKHRVRCPKCKCEQFKKRATELCFIDVDEYSICDDYIGYEGDEEYFCKECGRKLREGEME